MTLKCLIVEDSAFMREVYYFSLRDVPGIEIVAEAKDGAEAERLISELQPDVLLLDLILPLKNGLDILQEMPNLSPHTRTIVVSSLDEEEIVQKAKALGAIVYLKKPFTKTDLVSAMEEISRNYSEVQNG